MSEFENLEAMELSMDEMDQAAGGANRYKALTPKDGFFAYKVAKGDTLGKIAREFGCTVRDLMNWNPKITNVNQIYVNEFLYIRG